MRLPLVRAEADEVAALREVLQVQGLLGNVTHVV